MAGQADLARNTSNESSGVARQASPEHGVAAASDPPDGNSDDGNGDDDEDDPDPNGDDDIPANYRRCDRFAEQVLWPPESTWEYHNSVCTHRVPEGEPDHVSGSAEGAVNEVSDTHVPDPNRSIQQTPPQMEPPSPASEYVDASLPGDVPPVEAHFSSGRSDPADNHPLPGISRLSDLSHESAGATQAARSGLSQQQLDHANVRILSRGHDFTLALLGRNTDDRPEPTDRWEPQTPAMSDATAVSAIDTAASSVQSSLASQTQSAAAAAHTASAETPATPHAANLTITSADLAGQVASLTNASANTTAALQAIMDRLDASTAATLRAETTAVVAAMEAAKVAEKAERARATESERLSIWQTKMEAERQADSQTLEARLTPLVTSLVSRSADSATATAATERASRMTVLSELQSAVSVLQQGQTDSRTERLTDTALSALASAPQRTGELGTVGRGVGFSPSVLGQEGGAGAACVGGAPRNSYSKANFSESDWSRQTGPAFSANLSNEFDIALQRDITEAQARGRDTGAGVSIVKGRGHILPDPVPHRLKEPYSLAGKGSSEHFTGTKTSIVFKYGNKARRLAKSLTNEGMPLDSVIGKPHVSKNKLPWLTGDNLGVVDSATTGACCGTLVENFRERTFW